MKNIIIIAVALAGAVTTFAQDADQRPGRPPGGPGRAGGPPPIFAALDANKDGKLDAAEVANAAVVLGKLDKNGDGFLTPDELMGGGPRGEGRGPRDGNRRGPRPPQE